MILVDKMIKARANDIFAENYNEKYVTAVSYDLHIEGIIVDDNLENEYILQPGSIVFVKMQEKIHMPSDLLGRIGEKNSRIRQGLSVCGPHYYPGHNTSIFLRVHNITSNKIKLKRNDSIAQMFFEQLADIPDMIYSQQEGASFNEEYDYRGLADYKDAYESRMERIKNVSDEIEHKVNNVYANILTIMGIFVSIFSLIIVNFTSISDDHLTKEFIIPMNISLGIVIALFMGIILIFLNGTKSRKLLGGYAAILALLVVLLFVML